MRHITIRCRCDGPDGPQPELKRYSDKEADGIPSFDQFVAFVREFAGISPKVEIAHPTRFECDLGITGDDGSDLLQATGRRFAVQLSSEEHGYRLTFGLGPNEYLFHSEGFDLFGLCSRGSSVREFTIGELYDAMCRKTSDGLDRNCTDNDRECHTQSGTDFLAAGSQTPPFSGRTPATLRSWGGIVFRLGR